jgi:DNA-binding transcriptional MerR regulator
MRIGELARAAGVAPATVRYYERRGVLSRPSRTPSGYRSYPAEAVLQLQLVRWAKGVGFRLAEIRGLLALVRDHAHRPSGRVRARFKSKLDEVETRLGELTAMRDRLRELSACECDGACPIITRALAAGSTHPKGDER